MRSWISGSWGATTGGWRRRTSGKSNGCCSITRTDRSRRRTRASTRSGNDIARSGRPIRKKNRSSTAAAIAGPRCPSSFFCSVQPSASVEVEIAERFGHRLLFRLLQRFLEPLRQRVAARLFRFDRLLEDRLAPPLLLGQNPLCVAQLRLVAAIRLLVRHHPAEIRVNDERRLTAGADDFDLGFQARHTLFYFLLLNARPSAASAPSSKSFTISIGWLLGSFAFRRTSVICSRLKSKRWPNPSTKASSGDWNFSPAEISGVVIRYCLLIHTSTPSHDLPVLFSTVMRFDSRTIGSRGGGPHATPADANAISPAAASAARRAANTRTIIT